MALATAEWLGGRRRGDGDPHRGCVASTPRRRLSFGLVGLSLVVAVASIREAWPRYKATELRLHAREGIDALAKRNAGNPTLSDLAPVLAMLQQAVMLDPRHEQGWAELSMVLALRAHESPERSRVIGEEAEVAARRALALSEDVAWHWVRLGVALDLQGRWSDAGLAFGRAVQLAPRNARVWFYQGFHFSLKPTAYPLARSALATCLRLDGRIHQAEALQSALARSP